jgi:starch synthase
MASLLPIYLKEHYKDDALFSNSKIVTSIYNNGFSGTLSSELKNKVGFDNIENLDTINEASHINLQKIAIENSDAIITGSEDISDELIDYAKSLNKPVLEYQPAEDFADAYLNFYQSEVLQ